MSIAEKLEGLRPKICAVYNTVGILHASMDIDVQLIVAH
jgi:hypothetical protein